MKNLHLLCFSLKLCSQKWLKTMCKHLSAPSPSLRRLLYHPNRWRSMSGSVPLGSSTLTSKKWQGNFTAQRAYACSHPKNPEISMVKAVYCFYATSMAICQKSTFRSRAGKTSCPNQAFYGFLYFRKWIGIFLSSDIELTKINGKVQTSVLLAH